MVHEVKKWILIRQVGIYNNLNFIVRGIIARQYILRWMWR